MLKGHVFSKQIFENQIFALFINTFLNSTNGICKKYKNGMNLTYTNSSITINSGCVCIQGRFLEEATSTTLPLSTSSLYCKLVIEVNLDEVNTETELKQAKYKILTSTLNYPELTQQDIVDKVSGIYQYELGRFRTSESGISDFYEIKNYLDFDSIYQKLYEENNEQMKVYAHEYTKMLKQLRDEFEEVKNGTAYTLKSDVAAITVNIIEGSSNWTSRQSYRLDYPEGFNKDNCLVISCMRSSAVSEHFSTGVIGCALYENEISIDPVYSNDICKILLMKIPIYDNVMLGDVNLDGQVNNDDLLLIQGFLQGKNALTSKQLQAADMNNDGEVMTTDYVLLKNQLISQYQLGDVNMDGVIDQKDLTLLRNYLENSQNYPLNTIQLALADVTKDGSVNSADLNKLNKYLLGEIDSLE